MNVINEKLTETVHINTPRQLWTSTDDYVHTHTHMHAHTHKIQTVWGAWKVPRGIRATAPTSSQAWQMNTRRLKLSNCEHARTVQWCQCVQ